MISNQGYRPLRSETTASETKGKQHKAFQLAGKPLRPGDQDYDAEEEVAADEAEGGGAHVSRTEMTRRSGNFSMVESRWFGRSRVK